MRPSLLHLSHASHRAKECVAFIPTELGLSGWHVWGLRSTASLHLLNSSELVFNYYFQYLHGPQGKWQGHNLSSGLIVLLRCKPKEITSSAYMPLKNSFLWRVLSNLRSGCFSVLSFLFHFHACTLHKIPVFLHVCSVLLHAWGKNKYHFPKTFWTAGIRKEMAWFVYLNYWHSLQIPQIAKLGKSAMKTVSMKALLQRANSFR